jgi:hypothetical protein
MTPSSTLVIMNAVKILTRFIEGQVAGIGVLQLFRYTNKATLYGKVAYTKKPPELLDRTANFN